LIGWFGKRGRGSPQDLPPQKITTSNWGASAAPQMAPADNDGISRVFSKELFQGEIGDLLRSAGFSPDMHGNIAQTAETFGTMDARFRDHLARFVDRTNRLLDNGLSVKPLLLVPETVWQGEYRNFLCATCRFYPADPSNVFFLAGTPQTAESLGLPLRANMSVQEAHDFAVQIVGILGDMYASANAGGNSGREAASIAYEGARGLGTLMTVKLFDPPQYEPEHKLFGPPMDRDFDKLLAPNP
jgi:hypothetical protein